MAYLSSSPNPPQKPAIIAKSDSGASSHYLMTKDQQVLTNLQPTPFGPRVTLPDSTNIQASHSGQLPLHSCLSQCTKKAHILEGITNSSLISIGQLCDDNCIAILDKHQIEVYKDNTCALAGTRNTTNGLWDIPIPSMLSSSVTDPPTQQINAIIRKD
jgi:hypothetical protein